MSRREVVASLAWLVLANLFLASRMAFDIRDLPLVVETFATNPSLGLALLAFVGTYQLLIGLAGFYLCIGATALGRLRRGPSEDRSDRDWPR